MLVLGLMLIVTLLLVNSKDLPVEKVTAASDSESSCMIVYNVEDAWIRFLKTRAEKGSVPFSGDADLIITPISMIPIVNGHKDYGSDSCVIELHKLHSRSQGDEAVYRLIYRYSDSDQGRFFPVVNWLLMNSTWHSGGTVRIETQSRPIRQPVRETVSGTRTPELRVDADDRINLVSTMLLFTVQFFICCALFVSFTGQEKEQGILQAVALSPARLSEIILAKFSFHVFLALAYSGFIVLMVNNEALVVPGFWISSLLTCLGLIAIGTIIVALARTQAVAGLMTFGYILLNGLVIILSKQFDTFMAIQSLMFEYYSFVFIFLSLSDRPEQLFVAFYVGLGRMTAIVTVLMITAILLFRKYGWQAR